MTVCSQGCVGNKQAWYDLKMFVTCILAWRVQAKKAQMVARRDEDEWGTGELGEELLPQ